MASADARTSLYREVPMDMKSNALFGYSRRMRASGECQPLTRADNVKIVLMRTRAGGVPSSFVEVDDVPY
jgi:hypothetical protein